jgi:outer membrane protein, heavy metal efflux system
MPSPLQTSLRPGQWCVVLVALLLGACATPARDRGWSEVQGLIAQRDAPLADRAVSAQPDTVELDAQARALLAEPLTADRAVGLALLRNPRLRLSYARLGLAQAEWLEASRLSNPVLSLSALDSSESGTRTKFGYGLAQNFTELLFAGPRTRSADASLQAAQAAAAAEIQALAADVAGAWVRAASAEQAAQLHEVMARAARVSSDLAERYHAAGNLNALDLARERATAEQAELDAQSARDDATTARLALAQQLALPPDATWSLASALPLPVENETPIAELIALANTQRLDRLEKLRELAAVEQAQSLAQRLRWLPFVEVGVEGERDTDGARLLGPTLSLELPLFGRNQSGVLRTAALREQLLAQLAQLESDIAIEVAQEHARLLASARRAQRHREGLIPQREAIVERLQEMQNWMLVSPFELLLARRASFAAYTGYLDALRDYWLARVALTRAVGGALPSDARIGPADQRAPELPAATDPDPHAHHREPGAHH